MFKDMLPEEYRLKKNKEIRNVLKSGRAVKQRFLTLRVKENNLAAPRFAFLVSLKISKKATIRNRLKRKLREAVRLNLPRIKKNIDVVLIANSDFSNKTVEELKKLLYGLFN